VRVLLTVQAYRPTFGGSEEVVRNIAIRLAKRGHSVTVATGSDPRRPSDVVVDQVRVVSFAVSGNFTRGIRGDQERYVEFVGAGGFDVILNYAAQIWTTDALLEVLPRLKGTKIFAPCGFSGLRNPWLALLYRRYFRRLERAAPGWDAFVYHSTETRDWQTTEKWMLRRRVVIPNGVDRSEFSGASAGPTDGPLVLHVGNHYRAKAHDRVIRVFERAAGPSTRLLIVGDRPSSAWTCFERCARAAENDPRIRLVFGAPRQEVVQAYLNASVFLLASQVEAAPLVLLESMASRLPFVARNVGAIGELPGGIVASSDEELASALRALLENEGMATRLGREGAAFAQRLDWDVLVDQYEELFA
jgi:glycosyltransferase involved in cell wall biosynthesis